MALSHKHEEEFRKIIEDYTPFISICVHKFNLLKFGLDPDDIMQEVRIRIWKVLLNEKDITSYATYLKKIVQSAVIDQLRKVRRNEDLYNHEKQKRISEIDLAYRREIFRKKVLEEAIGRAVDRLIDSRKRVVKLYLLNLSIQEISNYLNWSQDKIRNLLYRGLADLREMLKHMDVKNED